jgi:hypothetical protein
LKRVGTYGPFLFEKAPNVFEKKIKKSDMSPTETFQFLTIGEVTRKLSKVIFDQKMQI